MMRRFILFDLLLPIIVVAGMAQYGRAAYSVIVSGQVPLWQLNSDLLISAGPLRYIKDAVVAGISIAWLITLPRLPLSRRVARFVRVYFVWLAIVMSLGLVGFLLNYSPLFFLPAGLRWILLLHASFGVFVLSSTLAWRQSGHKFVYWFLVASLLIDTYIVQIQFGRSAGLFGLAFGESRLTGLFSMAAVAGYFALAVALFAWQLDRVGWKMRMLITLWCLVLALSTGSRFATLAIVLVIVGQSWELMGRVGSRSRRFLKLFLVPLAAVVLFVSYQAVMVQVGRGDAIAQQFDEGGRAANLFEVAGMLSTADAGELLFGRGLGIGTNTARTAVISTRTNPSQYRFNILIDNAFATAFFQFGLLGSIVFWFGVWKFLAFARPAHPGHEKNRYLVVLVIVIVSLFAGNPFEQFFLMMAFASSVGSVYGSTRPAYVRLEDRKSLVLPPGQSAAGSRQAIAAVGVNHPSLQYDRGQVT